MYSYLKHWILGVLLRGVDHLQQHFLKMSEGWVELLGLPQLWYPQDEHVHSMVQGPKMIFDLDLQFLHKLPVKTWVSKLKGREREWGRGTVCFIHMRMIFSSIFPSFEGKLCSLRETFLSLLGNTLIDTWDLQLQSIIISIVQLLPSVSFCIPCCMCTWTIIRMVLNYLHMACQIFSHFNLMSHYF